MSIAASPADPNPLVPRPESGRVYTACRRVRLADASAGGRLRFDACARYLQDIANDDSRDAGTPNPTAWVARRTTITVDHFPKYLDIVSLATWCSGIGPRWAERRYSVIGERDGDGSGDGDDRPAGVIEAVTLWVHVDMATMKPVSLPPGFTEQFGGAAGGRVVSARHNLPTRPPKDVTDVPGVDVSEWPLRFVDYDVLGHVNNSVYWAMVEEQLARRRELRSPLTVALEHHEAIAPGAAVRVTVIDAADGFDLWVASDDGRVAAVVRAAHRPRT